MKSPLTRCVATGNALGGTALGVATLGIAVLGLAVLGLGCRSARDLKLDHWTGLYTGAPGQLEQNFKGFQQDTVPTTWRAEGDAITLVGSGGGDLVTREDFEDFELTLEWKIAPRGNSGIMFHVSEDPQYSETYFTGPEMQVLDNALFDGDVDMLHAAGANYALHAPPADYSLPVGEWNRARIRVEDGRVQQWLNGQLCCDYVLGSEDWKKRVTASKFGAMPGYGVQGHGKIVLQDHGDQVWYRNIAVSRLD
ncbi:MAG: DUF1080 domain-containing protein [Planctomycetota bacterium]